jgi:chitodextrinase
MANELSATDTINQGDSSTANHSRWMTEIWTEIADLKIHQLLLPSTHNAAADLKKLWDPIRGVWAACQDDSFAYQLANGARVFDLRVQDHSYHKPTGKFGQQLVEKVGFEHYVDTGRQLNDCVETLRAFATNNPKELIILSIESYKAGIKNSIDRGRRYLEPLDHLLIPESARNLTLREISETHPRRNVIIAAPGNLRTSDRHFWPGIRSMWAQVPLTSTDPVLDASIESLETYTNKLFNSSVQGIVTLYNTLWIFQAHARNTFGSLRLTSKTEYFRKFYDQNGNRGTLANIINVDFIKDTGLVDFCISTNKQRAIKYPAPSAPSMPSAVQVATTEQVRLIWSAPQNTNISHYEVAENGERLLTPRSSPAILNSVSPGIHTYGIRTIDTLGRRSPYCQTTIDVKDIAPPSTPGNLRLTDIKMTSTTLAWSASHDVWGIKGYEVRCNDQPLDFIDDLSYTHRKLESDTAYRYEIRAQDNSGFYSKVAAVLLPRRPQRPVSASFRIDELNWSTGKHLGLLEWQEAFASDLDYDYEVTVLPDNPVYIAKSVLSHWMLVDEGVTYRIEIRARLKSNVSQPGPGIPEPELSAPLIFSLSGDSQPPGAVRTLDVNIAGDSTTTLTWSPASGKVAGYAVMVNNEAPIFVPDSPCQYSPYNLLASQANTFEVWAVNANGVPGESATIAPDRDTEPPTQPGTPAFSNVTSTSALVTWAKSTDNVEVTGYHLHINDDSFTTTQTSYSLTGLKAGASYTVEIIATDAAGNLSLPSCAQFKIETLKKPESVQFSHLGGIGRLTWTAASDREINYEIYANDVDISAGQGASAQSFRLHDVPAGPVYRLKIRARKATDVSDFVQLQETVADWSRPSNPGLPAASNVTETSATLTWTASSTIQPLKGYRVSVNGLYLKTVGETHFSLNALIGGVGYLFTVRAEDVSGNLSDGMVGGFRTLGDPPMVPPGTPQNLHVSEQTADSVTLAWNKGAGEGIALGYRISTDDERFNGNSLMMEKTIKGLTAGLVYAFEVRGYDIFQQVSEPAIITVTVVRTAGVPV